MGSGKVIRPPGTVIGGKYELLKKIGEGGMSVVYLAVDLRLGTNWAVKEVLKVGVGSHADEVTSLLTETKMLQRLSHPRLPRIVDIIENEDSRFLVEDYIPGKTLISEIQESGALPQADVITCARQLCEVLAYLHAQKPPIIYRDMKPGNIMRKPGVGVVLFDFGIAREYRAGALDDTRPYGTPGYAAPEQMDGLCQSDVRTDIYNLGATLYHLVTGENPRACGHSPLAIRKVNPQLSEGLERIILKCTRTDPKDRYRDCAELLYALEHYTSMDIAHRRKQKRRLAAFLLPLCISVAAFAGAFFSYRTVLGERRDLYTLYLQEAQESAAGSIFRETYEPEVLKKYAATILLSPEREEGYLHLLDYAVRIGETQAGLDAVCTRIDMGAGGMDRNNAVLLRVARLYFGGNPRDAAFSVDYTKAAKYFSKIDSSKVPEAAYFLQLSMALGGFHQDTDWGTIGNTLKEFSTYNGKQILSESRIQNDRLAAGVYILGKRELSANGIDAYGEAILLLERALAGTRDLLEDTGFGQSASEKGGLEELQKQLLRDLVSAYSVAKAEGSPACDDVRTLALAEELVERSATKEELREGRYRLAELYRQQGEVEKTRRAYEKLVSWYPEEANAYLRYASWLYDRGELAEAARQYRKAGKCKGAEGNPAYASLGIKLENADAL